MVCCVLTLAPRNRADAYVPISEFEDGLMRSELETRMLHLQPSELLLQKELSPKTESMVQHLVGQHKCVRFFACHTCPAYGRAFRSAGTADFRSRIDRISKRASASQATSQISDYFASIKKREKGKEKASNGKALRKESSEIVLSSGDEGEGADTEISRAALNGAFHIRLTLKRTWLTAISQAQPRSSTFPNLSLSPSLRSSRISSPSTLTTSSPTPPLSRPSPPVLR